MEFLIPVTCRKKHPTETYLLFLQSVFFTDEDIGVKRSHIMYQGHTVRIKCQFINVRLIVKNIAETAFNTGWKTDL